MTPVRECKNHTYFSSDKCPECGKEGKKILDEELRIKLSKFMSGALRHFPEDANISVNENGWVDIKELISSVNKKYTSATEERIKAVIHTDPKGRFETKNTRIRAAYGHSIDVNLEDNTEKEVPKYLYHGTDPSNLDSIMQNGLLPMERQEVHLSETIKEAKRVGKRHSKNPVLLKINSGKMENQGLRITKRGKEVYTADKVPSKYISKLD